MPNLLGNGVSFSPSTAARAGLRWPAGVTIADNVRAQRALLDALGVDLVRSPIELIYGYSMGALQASVAAMRPPCDRRATAVTWPATHPRLARAAGT